MSIIAWAAVFACAACTPLATWPPTEGKAVLAPWAEPCPQLMATSVTFTRQNTTPEAPLVFNLPPGTEWKVWEEVRRQLGPDSRAMVTGDTTVFDVRMVRVDGGHGEVDVIYRTPDGVWQMATTHFTGAFGSHFRPTYFQRWVIPVDPPVANDPGPPPPKPPPPPHQGAWPKEGSQPSSPSAASEPPAAAPPPEPPPSPEASQVTGGTRIVE